MKKFFFLFVLLNLFRPPSLQAQQPADSLLSVLKTEKEDSGKVNTLNVLCGEKITMGDYASASEYADEALALAEKINFKKGMADSYTLIVIIYLDLPDYLRALEYYQKIVAINEQMGNKTGIANNFQGMGNASINLSDYPKALEYYQKALTIHEQLGDKKNVAADLGNIGVVSASLSNYHKALEYYQKALTINEQLGDKDGIGLNLGNMGSAYSGLSDYSRALEYYQRVLTLNEQSGNKDGIATILGNMGDAYFNLSDYPKAMEFAQKELKIAQEIKDKYLIASAYSNLEEINRKQGNLNEALKYAAKGLSLAQEIGSKGLIRDDYRELTVLDSAMNDFRGAYENHKLYMQVNDSMFNSEKDRKITSLQMKYDFDKIQDSTRAEQEKKDVLTQKEIQKQELVRNGFIGGFAVVLLFAGVFFTQRNKIKKGNKLILKEKEVAEQQRLRAEQSERYKQQFLANMSHEIRTPMNAVMGMTNLLLDKNPRSDQFNYLDGIKKSSDNLLHIINDILDLSKVEAGKIELEQIDFSIQEIVNQIKQTLLHKAEEKGLQLLSHVDGNIPHVLVGDPARLNQVLLNLTGNAIKFTEKGSVTVEVRGHAEPVEAQREQSRLSLLSFHITDTGIGIPQEKLQTVFESFSQAHSSDARRFGGTGLGLTISKQLVELMGGKISVESEEGSGTTFSFEINLPIGSTEKLNQQKSAGEIDGSVLNGMKILLVEDNEYNRIVAMDTLKSKAKIEINSATNGREAIELFTQKDYDVILMDVQMPELDGYEATQKIRKEFSSPKNQIPIIALTASVIRSDLDKCKAAGMNGYIPKPFNASQLISTIAEVTGRMQPTLASSPLTINNSPLTIPDSPLTIHHADLTFLKNFCEGDEQRMKKYITLFLDAVPPFRQKIEKAISENDLEEIARQVHAFRPKLMMMGMKDAQELAVNIERQCTEETNSNEVTRDINQKLGELMKQLSISIQ